MSHDLRAIPAEADGADAIESVAASLAAIEGRLDAIYDDINTIILERQNPLTGLFPASTESNHHGDYTDAWVRDNVYSIVSVWALGMAYRHNALHPARAYHLEQSAVKMMRGLLMAMMRQSDKVEKFKFSLAPVDALHAKYSTTDATSVVDDDAWGHLQFDATAIFLIALVRMTRSGLRIIFGQDEVDFVQNLVHYIGPAYRIPDYGIWERGHKTNNGKPEINCSSVGMVKAALEEIDQFNLFGEDGASASGAASGAQSGEGIIHVIQDEVARSRTTLQSQLPGESRSKEVDAALLSVIGFPAFAVEEPEIVAQTRDKILSKLAGHYGLKRFLLDGHQTALEDTSRLHYEASELLNFSQIESEWPLFYCYLYLNALFDGDLAKAAEYRAKLEQLMVERDGRRLLPELYYVTAERVEAEKQQPHSQPREANANVPLVWAQSLYFLAVMLDEGLLPQKALLPVKQRRDADVAVVPRLVLICPDETMVQALAKRGLVAQTLAELAPVKLCRTAELGNVLLRLGENSKLGLSGRPLRTLRVLTTSKAMQINGQPVLFVPQYQYQENFYLGLDSALFRDRLESDIAYLKRHWRDAGQPLIALYINAALLNAEGSDELFGAIAQWQQTDSEYHLLNCRYQEQISTIKHEQFRVAQALHLGAKPLDPLQVNAPYLALDATRCAPIDEDLFVQQTYDLGTAQLVEWLYRSCNLYEQAELLYLLAQRVGIDESVTLPATTSVTVRTLAEELLTKASHLRLWSVIRLLTGLLENFHLEISSALAEILSRQIKVIFGRGFSGYQIVSEPVSHAELKRIISRYTGKDPRERVLVQELIVLLALICRGNPALFRTGLRAVRLSDLLASITYLALKGRDETRDQGFDALTELSPSRIRGLLEKVLVDIAAVKSQWERSEQLRVAGATPISLLHPVSDALDTLPDGEQSWLQWRIQAGSVLHITERFQQQVWHLLQSSKGIILGDPYAGGSRINSAQILSTMTSGERSFVLYLEHLLQVIQAPEYRQLCQEVLRALFELTDRNPDLQTRDYLVLDTIIHRAVRQHWLTVHPEHAAHYDQYKQDALLAFYLLSPKAARSFFVLALNELLQENPL